MSCELKILYLGPVSGTCLDRANAFRRLGHLVQHVDPRGFLPDTVWVDRVIWRLGGQCFAPLISARLVKYLDNIYYDVCYVDGGELLTSAILKILKNHVKKVINYNIDDPLGPRDGARFRAYRQSLPYYDLVVVVRVENISEAQKLGAKNVMRVFRSADEVSHAPRTLTDADHQRWDSEVLFLGTWFPERGPFLVKLLELGVPLTIRGGNWHKAPEWKHLQSCWRGGSISGDEYAKAIQCAKVNIGLLSMENRDLHTTRSLEIPALGALFCAERTTEHLAMYREGEEALYWSTALECAQQCKFALSNEVARITIADAGLKRVVSNGHFNEVVMANILEAAFEE